MYLVRCFDSQSGATVREIAESNLRKAIEIADSAGVRAYVIDLTLIRPATNFVYWNGIR